MTISQGLVLFCNGKRGRCGERLESSEMHADALLLQARNRGWSAPTAQSLHLCPRCSTRLVPEDVGLDILDVAQARMDDARAEAQSFYGEALGS